MITRRRYEIEQSPKQVRDDVLEAIGGAALIELDIKFTGIYEDGLEIPPSIQQRSITVDITNVSKLRDGQLRANGFTEPERQAVSLIIPSEDASDEPGRLSLIDR